MLSDVVLWIVIMLSLKHNGWLNWAV